MKRAKIRRDTMMAYAALIALFAGCAKPKFTVTNIPVKDVQLSTQPTSTQAYKEPDCQAVDEMGFLECMTRKTKCTFADAVRAVCLMMNGSDVGKSYEERYQYLLKKGAIREGWRLKPDQWVDRGTLSYMLLKAGKIEGGLNLAIFGSMGLGERRYAYREMLYHGLMDEGCDYQYVSGPELVTTTGKVDRFMQEGGDNSANRETDLGQRTQYGY